MNFKKSWFSNDEKKKKDGSYLKYEEGEVVPVESKTSYPPFLTDKDDDENVKQFKDVQRQEEARRHAQAMLKKQENMKNDSDSPSVETTGRTDLPNETSKPSKKPSMSSLLMKGLWLVIIGGLVYYSIPMFQYFGSETPDLSGTNQTVEQVKETVTQSTEKAGDVANAVTETTGKVVDKVSEGSGLVDAAKENLTTSPQADSQLDTLSQDQWLTYFSSVQNQKQEHLVTLQKNTAAFIHGQIKASKYRLEVKGVTNKIERLQAQLKETVTGKDLSEVRPVVTILETELEDLESMSVSLSSVGSSSVAQVFNTGVKEQNELTEQYKSAFKSLLDRFGKSYVEEDGVIKYK